MGKKGKEKPLAGRRRRGKPAVTERAVGAEELALIADLYLTGHSLAEIAARLDVAKSTVQHHVEAQLRPQWRAETAGRREERLAEVMLIRRRAWECFRESKKPETRQQVKRELIDSGAGKDAVEQVVQRVFTRTRSVGDTAWLDVVRWCIDFEAKVFGWYAPTKHELRPAGEFRVAGMSPAEVDEAMLRRWKELQAELAERRKFEQGLSKLRQSE